MNWLDIVFTLVILAIAAVSHSRGTLRSFFTLGGVVCGVWLGGRWYPGLADWFSTFLKEPSQSSLLAFILLAAVIAVAVSAFGAYVLGLLTFDVEGILDRLGGLGVGIVTALLVTQMLFTTLATFPVNGNLTLGVRQSGLGPPLLEPRWNAALWLMHTDEKAIRELFEARS